MKKINWTIVVIGAITITELIILKQATAGTALFVLYGIYKAWEQIEF